MTEYFDYFVEREFPEGATHEQRAMLNKYVGEIEDYINDVFPQTLDCPVELQNKLYIAAYEVLRYKRVN